MNDIVDRLRRYKGPWLVPAEAADEIERLRNEIVENEAQIRDDMRQLRILKKERDRAVARYEYVRRLNVPEFQKLFMNCLNGARFDELVDFAIDDEDEETWARSIK